MDYSFVISDQTLPNHKWCSPRLTAGSWIRIVPHYLFHPWSQPLVSSKREKRITSNTKSRFCFCTRRATVGDPGEGWPAGSDLTRQNRGPAFSASRRFDRALRAFSFAACASIYAAPCLYAVLYAGMYTDEVFMVCVCVFQLCYLLIFELMLAWNYEHQWRLLGTSSLKKSKNKV